MNQLPLNKNELPLVREILTKYKQGYISGLIPGSNITMTPSGCRNKIISSTGGGGTSYVPPYLKSGGASWSGTGLVYDVTTLEYYFNGDKLTASTQVTLDASDPIDNRLDAIVVDEAGVVSVIKGDASASPISPSVDESHILVQYILVEAGSTQPTIAKEDIYLENAEWTTSTYTTGAATGSIDFDNAVSPKQGVKCISANSDTRLGARFVRVTSFDPYQYTMLSLWVRFTGSNVATNKSLNVRFENGAGALVANTINLFNFGLQRNLLNVWQLVVIPITSFGTLPTSVKGLKIIMTGGTVGQARQWDIDLISLTDNSVPSINEQVFNVLKDGTLVGQSSSLNFKGSPVTVTNDPVNKKIDVEVAGGGGGGSSFLPNGNEFITESRDFQASDEGKLLILLGSNITLTMPSGVTFTQGATLGIYSVGINNKFQSLQGGAFIEPYAGGEEDNNGEIVYLTVSSDGVNDILSSVSSAFVAEKTLNKYLYDKANANNYFGTATLAMGTVTVSDIRVKTGDIIFVSVNTPSGTLGFLSASTADIVDGTEFVINSSSALDNSTVNWWIKTP